MYLAASPTPVIRSRHQRILHGHFWAANEVTHGPGRRDERVLPGAAAGMDFVVGHVDRVLET